MKIRENVVKMCYEVYCDTDSEYNTMQQILGRDIDSKRLMKCYLNSVYGKAVTDMNKGYIVIHEECTNHDIRVGIIFKSKIAGILKASDGTAVILLDSGYNQFCTESYEDIIKQIV